MTHTLNPKGRSIGAAVFAGLTSVTDRPTDHATRSVRIGRIYVRSTAMRPNNKYNCQALLMYMYVILRNQLSYLIFFVHQEQRPDL